jgi:hypothetical protein
VNKPIGLFGQKLLYPKHLTQNEVETAYIGKA